MAIKRNAKKTKHKKFKVPKTVQQSIPYLYVYEDNGIIEISEGVYTKSYELRDINYQVAKEQEQEDMFEKYSAFLNSFDSNVKFQICINNKSIDKKMFEDITLLKEKYDGFDELREEYNEMLRKKINEGRNNMEREKYLTLRVEADSLSEAELIFSRLDGEISVNLRKVGGSDATPLSTMERLRILHDLYNPDEVGTFGIKKYEDDEIISESFSFENMRKQGLSTKDCIAPMSFEFKRDYMRVGDKYARALFLKDIPSRVADNVLSELTNMNCHMLTSLNLESVPADEALKRVKNQLTNVNATMIEKQKRAARNGYSFELTSPDLQKAINDGNNLLEELTTNNQKMFMLTLTIVHFADNLDDLNVDTQSIQSTARRLVCEIKPLTFLQENGLATTLPLANNKLAIKRTLTTYSTAVFMPFVSQELQQKGGFYYGLNAVSKNLLLFNRKLAKNGNGFILGTPGGGKSFAAKNEMLNVLLNTDDDVIVIDPEGEYYPMADLLHGQVVRIATGSNVHINPMDMDLDYADGDDPITLKSDFIISLCETAVNARDGLSSRARSIIDRCCKAVYEDYVQDAERHGGKANKDLIPTLLDFQRKLEEQSSQNNYVAQELAESFEIFTKGSLNIFAHKTNVEYNNRFVVYNIRDIGSTIKAMGLLVVLDNIWNRIIENSKKGKYTWVYIDEIYLLFKTENSANFLKELFKRARKFYGIPTGITQNVGDLLENDIARTMISNCEYIQMLNQAPLDRRDLSQLLNISETQLSYITNSSPGEGLLYNGSSIIPFVNQFPKNKLYYVMTTKPSEIKKRRG